jgi:hypothetical protein
VSVPFMAGWLGFLPPPPPPPHIHTYEVQVEICLICVVLYLPTRKIDHFHKKNKNRSFLVSYVGLDLLTFYPYSILDFFCFFHFTKFNISFVPIRWHYGTYHSMCVFFRRL